MFANLKLKNIKYFFILLKPAVLLLISLLFFINIGIEHFLKNLAVDITLPYVKTGLEFIKNQFPLKTVLENLYDGKLQATLNLSDFPLRFQSIKVQFSFYELAIVEVTDVGYNQVKFKYLYNAEKKFDKYGIEYTINNIDTRFGTFYTTYIKFNDRYVIIVLMNIYDQYYLQAQILAQDWYNTERKLTLFIDVIILGYLIIIMKGRC